MGVGSRSRSLRGWERPAGRRRPAAQGLQGSQTSFRVVFNLLCTSVAFLPFQDYLVLGNTESLKVMLIKSSTKNSLFQQALRGPKVRDFYHKLKSWKYLDPGMFSVWFRTCTQFSKLVIHTKNDRQINEKTTRGLTIVYWWSGDKQSLSTRQFQMRENATRPRWSH